MIPKPSYVMRQPHLSGYHVILGYDSLTDAQDAHEAIATSTCGTKAEGRSEPNPPPEGKVASQREAVTHDLKTWPDAYDAVEGGLKPWEFRKLDRDYRVGDFLLLRCWSPEAGYDGRQVVRRVLWMLKGGQFSIPEGYGIMSLASPTEQSSDVSGLVEALKAARNYVNDAAYGHYNEAEHTRSRDGQSRDRARALSDLVIIDAALAQAQQVKP